MSAISYHVPIDKYALYEQAVQRPAADVRLMRRLFRDLKGRTPYRLREDFCGTSGVCREWVKLGRRYRAHGRDLSAEALLYGRTRRLPRLTPSQRRRVTTLEEDVLTPGGPSCDLVMAMNFSYSILKDRPRLKRYFQNCRKSLRPGGVLALDAFGGEGMRRPGVERTDHGSFVYYWETYGYDRRTRRARCAIHFKPKGRRKVRDVFTYHWRLWSLEELRALLAEAGFGKTHVYFEGGGAADKTWIALILAER